MSSTKLGRTNIEMFRMSSVGKVEYNSYEDNEDVFFLRTESNEDEDEED